MIGGEVTGIVVWDVVMKAIEIFLQHDEFARAVFFVGRVVDVNDAGDTVLAFVKYAKRDQLAIVPDLDNVAVEDLVVDIEQYVGQVVICLKFQVTCVQFVQCVHFGSEPEWMAGNGKLFIGSQERPVLFAELNGADKVPEPVNAVVFIIAKRRYKMRGKYHEATPVPAPGEKIVEVRSFNGFMYLCIFIRHISAVGDGQFTNVTASIRTI